MTQLQMERRMLMGVKQRGGRREEAGGAGARPRHLTEPRDRWGDARH